MMKVFSYAMIGLLAVGLAATAVGSASQMFAP